MCAKGGPQGGVAGWNIRRPHDVVDIGAAALAIDYRPVGGAAWWVKEMVVAEEILVAQSIIPGEVVAQGLAVKIHSSNDGLRAE